MRLAFALTGLCLGSTAAVAESATVEFPVPSVTIPIGDTLTAEALTLRRLVASATALRTHHRSRDILIGKVARRVLPAGSAIPLTAVRDAYAFKEGERVDIEFAAGGLSIRGSGVALQPGIVGQSARVRNVDTGIVLSGIVKVDGSIDLGGAPP